MTLTFIADLDSRTWDQFGEVNSEEFEVDICIYTPFETKIKNLNQNFQVELIGATDPEVERPENVDFFTRDNLDLPDFSARIFTSYKISGLYHNREYEMTVSFSNLRKEFSKSFIFKAN